MSNINLTDYHQAIQDFRTARRKGDLTDLVARLTGSSSELLSFEEVRQRLRAQIGSKTTLQEIPLFAIIGSVNRYEDFTRGFLPRKNIAEERWATVEAASYAQLGLPPIEVYQIGKAYFVKDGNHRVSVARQQGAQSIQAYVTEVKSDVQMTPDTKIDDLILMTEYADFLERSKINTSLPQADLMVSVPGKYPEIEEHIAVHRYFMGIEQQKEVPISEAQAHWYVHVYLPVIGLIRAKNMLRDFPGRTEMDMYLWLAEQQAAIRNEIGGSAAHLSQAANDLIDRYSLRKKNVAVRVIDALIPEPFDSGRKPGTWREGVLTKRSEDSLFEDVLIPVNGKEDGWFAFDQAVTIARRENARISGLHVVRTEADVYSSTTLSIQNDFNQRIEHTGITGQMNIVVGRVTQKIIDFARWHDLTILNLTYPPENTPLSRLKSGIRNLIIRCPTPVLATPNTTCPLDTLMLAFDNSPKAYEALFLSAYMAGKWNSRLIVLCVAEEKSIGEQYQTIANDYLITHGINVEYCIRFGIPGRVIVDTAYEQGADLVLMGGYRRSPVIQAVLDNTVDQVLRKIHLPVLLCQ